MQWYDLYSEPLLPARMAKNGTFKFISRRDSRGDPLVHNEIVGVVSNAIIGYTPYGDFMGCHEEYLNIYSRVYYYLDYIKGAINT